jgi:hypothetical protein
MDAEILMPDNSYTALELVNDMQQGVWSELKTEAPRVDVCRRALQRSYLEIMKRELLPSDGKPAGAVPFGQSSSDDNTDLRAVARVALAELAVWIDAALPRTRDAITVAHLMDCRREVELLLKGKS